MSQVSLVSKQSGHYTLEGKLNRDTVMELATAPAELWQHQAVTLDLSGLRHTDTAGLAWLLELVAESRQHDIRLNYTKVPELLLKLAKISDVDDLLPLQ